MKRSLLSTGLAIFGALGLGFAAGYGLGLRSAGTPTSAATPKGAPPEPYTLPVSYGVVGPGLLEAGVSAGVSAC